MVITPNFIAWFALGSWAFIAIGAFAVMRPAHAGAITFFGSYMFLPSAISFDFPVIPPLTKEGVASVGALIGCLIFCRHRLVQARIGRGPDLFLLLMFLGGLGTNFTNSDPLAYGIYGQTLIPGHSVYDAASVVVRDLLFWGIPFVIGRSLIRTRKDLEYLILVFAIGGLVYSLLILLEVRLSPRLHLALYGYHQHSFAQQIRFGGYRPMVFMRHGLNVALFVTFCVLATATLARARRPLFNLPANVFTAYLSFILVACKSVGAIIYALFFLPVALLASPKNQLRVAVVVAALVFSYPVIRAVDLVPTDAITGFIASHVSESRAGSLSYRFVNEALIMNKARERLLFGWGDYSRFWRYDPITGEPVTIVDGLWAITIGSRGLVGHISVFGLLLFPIFNAWRKLRFVRASRDRSLIAGLSLIAAVFACDFIPNSSVDAAITFCVGGLAGVVPGILREQRLSMRRSGERSRRAPEERIGAPG